MKRYSVYFQGDIVSSGVEVEVRGKPLATLTVDFETSLAKKRVVNEMAEDEAWVREPGSCARTGYYAKYKLA